MPVVAPDDGTGQPGPPVDPGVPAGGAYATAADVAAGWKPLDAEETARANVLLGRASAVLRGLTPGLDDRIAAGTVPKDLVVAVVAPAVVDAMQRPEQGVESTSYTTGPFSRTLRWSDAVGGFRFPADLLGLLRAPRRRVQSIRMVSTL